MRRLILMALPFVASLGAATAARAVVVDMSQVGQTSVAYNSADLSSFYGVALVPSSREGTSTTASYLANAGIPWVSTNGPCADPAAPLESDLLPNGSWPLSAGMQPLCWHGGPVVHSNETFTLQWESAAPNSYWSGTSQYVQQFLKDVASNSADSPYSDTAQYWDGQGAQYRAADTSAFGGGCDDSGTAQCQFGTIKGSGPGNALPSTSDCPVSGTNDWAQGPGGVWTTTANNLCMTDADIRQEVTSMVDHDSLIAHTQPGYTPLVVVLTPPGAEVCLDSAGKACSANSGNNTDPVHPDVQFCSYHGQVNDPASNQEVAYVVQPWTAFTRCNEPDVPAIPANPTPEQLSIGAGQRLVSPLSQAEMAAIVNPAFNGWTGLNGLEINDENSCQPLANQLDKFGIGSGTYWIQREFNNAAVINNDPYTYSGCLPQDVLTPTFVAPSAINLGDTLDLDGSATASALLVSKDNYQWDFGDGTTGTGPSVEHTYGQAGTYTVKLTVTDRGGHVATLSQSVDVLTSSGLPVPPPSPVPTTTSPSGSDGSSTGGSPGSGLNVSLQLMPQALRALLVRGVTVRVSSSEPADGFATISISRKAAERAHIKVGNKAVVVVGTGTVAGVQDGTITLHLHMAASMAKKLAHLKHVTLTVRLALVDKAGNRAAVNVAGRY